MKTIKERCSSCKFYVKKTKRQGICKMWFYILEDTRSEHKLCTKHYSVYNYTWCYRYFQKGKNV